MRLTEFRKIKISEASGDDLRAKYNAIMKTLKLKGAPDEGFWGKNTRNNANNEILAQFARDNNLPGMYHPNGNWIKFGVDDEGLDSDEVDSTSSPDFDEMERMAKLGAIPSGIRDRLNQEIADYSSGDRSLWRRGGLLSNILGTPDPESANKLNDILKVQDATIAAAEVKPIKTPALDAEAMAKADAETADERGAVDAAAAEKAADAEAMAKADAETADERGAADAAAAEKAAKVAPAKAASKAPYSMGTPGAAYKIKRGDNLTKIAKAHGTTVDAIMKANPNIKDANRIAAGGALNIPGAKKDDTTYAKPTPSQSGGAGGEFGGTPTVEPAQDMDVLGPDDAEPTPVQSGGAGGEFDTTKPEIAGGAAKPENVPLSRHEEMAARRRAMRDKIKKADKKGIPPAKLVDKKPAQSGGAGKPETSTWWGRNMPEILGGDPRPKAEPIVPSKAEPKIPPVVKPKPAPKPKVQGGSVRPPGVKKAYTPTHPERRGVVST
jgi:LysM repeat protein